MPKPKLANYLLSLPERALRSVTALAGGFLREIGDVALPGSVRRTRLYRTMVESTLRFLIERVGAVEGAFPSEEQLANDFLLRRTAGNGIEIIGLLAFRASPVWVLAALADLSGAGRHLIGEISESLKREGLLRPDLSFETMDQILDGLEQTSGRLAESINTPPLNVTMLRKEWASIQEHATRIPPRNLPSLASLEAQWQELQNTARAERRTTLEMSAVMAISAVRRLPENLLWLSRCTQSATGAVSSALAASLLDHYREALTEIRSRGFIAYWTNEFRPYLAAAARHFSPQHKSLTEKFLE